MQHVLWYYAVYTQNGNEFVVPTPNDEAGEDGLYACSDNGGGDVLFDVSIQAIKEISITFKFPTATVQSHGGYFGLYVADYATPYYTPQEVQYREVFYLTNDDDKIQTQTVTISEPSKCHYVAWWYAVPFAFDEGNTIISDVTVKYSCSN